MRGLLARFGRTRRSRHARADAVCGLQRLRGLAARIGAAVGRAVHRVRARHDERLRAEPAYRSALAAGLSALLGTIAPQPVLAAAVAVLAAEHLGLPNRPPAADLDDADETKTKTTASTADGSPAWPERDRDSGLVAAVRTTTADAVPLTTPLLGP